MERHDTPGKCWNCDGIHNGYYMYECAMFYTCELCGADICLDFSSLMPMFGVSLADEWKAEEEASKKS